MGLKIAVVGATGNVGTEILTILDESDLTIEKVYAVASRRSLGRVVSYGDKELKCLDIEQFDFAAVDIVLMSAGGAVSKEWSPKIVAAGCKVVIDNSSTWRMDPAVPLVVPEVNADAVEGFAKKGIIANPNCSTIQMVVALKPLHDAASIKRVVVSTYQSTSGGDNTLLRGRTIGTGPDPFQNVHGAGYRGVYDFADPDSSVFVISTGQSGHFLSRHYDDLGELWRRGEYVPMSLDPELTDAMIDLTIRLLAQRSIATVFVTHSPAEAKRLATRTLHLKPVD
ncbi:MAG: aspartate-semialdehyde dehydrogenase [Robiginitomaculum sp.]|nr:MAG: aspartate-semialdehyde dehydrogenase [Robiginitomaculum sp.]